MIYTWINTLNHQVRNDESTFKINVLKNIYN
jgi:hypothetical protein